MAELSIRTGNIDFLVQDPRKLSDEEWGDVRQLHSEAVVAALLGLEKWRAESFVTHQDPSQYSATRKNPNEAVEQGILRPQLIRDGIIVRAIEGDELVGFATNYNATSGPNAVARVAKMLIPAKRWAWTWDMAVRPDKQNRGIAHVMGLAALCRREAEQPTSAYTYPEFENVGTMLKGAGFVLQEATEVDDVFGGSHATELLRYTANTGQVRENILAMTGIDNARNHIRVEV